MAQYSDLKREAYEANIQIPNLGLGGIPFGGVSALDPTQGVFAIKPSGIPCETMLAEDMVVVDLSNEVVEGKYEPSAATKTHAVLYRTFDGIRGVAHTRSTYATAWAQACLPIPVYGANHAEHLPEEIPCTKGMNDDRIISNYESEIGYQIVSTLRGLDPARVEMALVACHGPISWGTSAIMALRNSLILEEIARTAFLTRQLNQELKPLKHKLIDKLYRRKQEATAK